MKKLLACICLLTACSETDIEQPKDLTGNWQMSWVTDEEIRSAQMKLSSNGKAYLTMFADANSALLTTQESASYSWKFEKDVLQLKRIDNPIELHYRLVDHSENSVRFQFLEDIEVVLTR